MRRWFWLNLCAAGQQCLRSLRPQRSQVQITEGGNGFDNRLRSPGADLGGKLDAHRRRCFGCPGRCGSCPTSYRRGRCGRPHHGLHIQQRLQPRQIAARRSRCCQQQRLRSAGNSRQHIALHLHLQRQRRARQHAGLAFVVTRRKFGSIKFEGVPGSVKLIAARQVGDWLRQRTRRSQQVNRKFQIHLKRQNKIVQRGLAADGAERAFVINDE